VYKKRRNYTRDQHWDDIRRYTGWWRTVTALFGLMLVGFTAWSFHVVSGVDQRYDAQIKVVDALQLQTPTGRMELANDMIQLHWHQLGPSVLNDGSFLTMVSYVARTGNDAWLTTGTGSWHDYVYVILPRIAFLAVVSVSVLLAATYALGSEGKHYLADLPWRKPWVWWYVLLVPMLWMPLAYSAVQIRRHGYIGVTPRGKRIAPDIDFEPDEVGAAMAYREMRKQSLTTWRQRFIEQSEARLGSLQKQCTDLGNSIRRHQRERTELLAKIKQVSARDPSQAVPSDDELAHEFNRMLQLPGVRSIRPTEEGIELLVNATIMHGRRRYDLGTWKLYLGWIGEISTTELRSGVRSSWQDRGPVYRDEDEFCFGDSERFIVKHLTEGQVLEAAVRAVQCLNSVNRNHRRMIPRAFKRVEGELV
jgi:hypothetical protein